MFQNVSSRCENLIPQSETDLVLEVIASSETNFVKHGTAALEE
jgi:hypothetical protein